MFHKFSNFAGAKNEEVSVMNGLTVNLHILLVGQSKFIKLKKLILTSN